MDKVSPSTAASLASRIYSVRDEFEFEDFLATDIFDRAKSSRLSANIGGRLISIKDGFGICAMGDKRYQGDAFFIFRGTARMADVVTDGRIGLQNSKSGFLVHIGFNEAFKSMLEDIKSFVAENKITGVIHCIGHSLGGAVATLAADWLKSQTGSSVKLYTFGQPRVGLDHFALKLTSKLGASNIHRVFHETDPVPMIPIFPYLHSPLPGNGHLIKSAQLVFSGAAHKMDSYIKSVAKKQWLELKREPPLANIEYGVQQFLKAKTPLNPESPITFKWLDAALVYILKKVLGAGIAVLHTAVVSFNTLADRIAWVLIKGIDLTNQVSEWVELFVEKIMRLLGMPAITPGQPLTQAFLASILTALIQKANNMARRAIHGM